MSANSWLLSLSFFAQLQVFQLIEAVEAITDILEGTNLIYFPEKPFPLVVSS